MQTGIDVSVCVEGKGRVQQLQQKKIITTYLQKAKEKHSEIWKQK